MSWHCKKCDSKNIEVRDWVNPNTGRSRDSYVDSDEDMTWCKQCCDATLGIVWKDDP